MLMMNIATVYCTRQEMEKARKALQQACTNIHRNGAIHAKAVLLSAYIELHTGMLLVQCSSDVTSNSIIGVGRKELRFSLVLYRLPYFSHVPMSNYFTFQTTDISIRYQLLQTYNKSYKD